MDTMTMTPDERNKAVDMMLRIGGYEETPAFDRWAHSDEAEPILRQWMTAGQPLPQDAFFAVDFAEEERADEEREALTAHIKQFYGASASSPASDG